MVTFINLAAIDGKTADAVAFARHEGELLPPGIWLVRAADPIPDVHHGGVLMSVEDMPPHWQEQLKSRRLRS